MYLIYNVGMIRDAGSPYIVQPMEKWDNFAESVEVILLIYLLRMGKYKITIRCLCRCLVENARRRIFPLSALSTRISLTQVGLIGRFSASLKKWVVETVMVKPTCH